MKLPGFPKRSRQRKMYNYELLIQQQRNRRPPTRSALSSHAARRQGTCLGKEISIIYPDFSTTFFAFHSNHSHTDCLCPGMGLVEYSDSSTDSEPEEPLPPKKKLRTSNDAVKQTLPALPTAFHDLYASSIRVSVRDDPNLHGGRKRVIPHVEGNWPTHIYLECKFDAK